MIPGIQPAVFSKILPLRAYPDSVPASGGTSPHFSLVVPWEYYRAADEQQISFSEVLQQICILGNCSFIVKGTMLMAIIRKEPFPADIITPAGDLQILERNDVLPDNIDFTIHEDTTFNLKGSNYFSDWMVHVNSGMKTNDDLDSIWQDTSTNQWKLIAILSSTRLIFEHYPTNPPAYPGYGLPDPPSTLTWVSGGVDQTDIVYDYDSDASVYHDNAWIDTKTSDFYEDNYYNYKYKEYPITGINSFVGTGVLKVSRYFTHEGMTLLVKSIKRDLRFIEDTYQPVDILALRRIE